MRVVKAPWFVALSLLFAVGIALSSWTSVNAADAAAPDAVKIAALVKEMNSLTPSRLHQLEALPIKPFELPPPGVDVMRARLTETYSIDGVGRDEVELSGWIAVRHSNARPVPGASKLEWNTAIVDTEFVGMNLRGYSEVFGPVSVILDESRPSKGAVGQIELPAKAEEILLASTAVSEPEPEPTTDPIACEASANVAVLMPDLELEMHTATPVAWYSIVETIPPVGHTASIAIEPVRLISGGREVGTLESGIVKFRELVRHVRLTDDPRVKVASTDK
jgi:hypothetical protein